MKKGSAIMKLKIMHKSAIDEEIAKIYIDLINKRPNCVLGLATGSSGLGVYANLVKSNREGKVSFKDVVTFNLDEYVGLNGTHPQSYRYFMNHNLFDHVDIKKENTSVPSGIGDLEANAIDYDRRIIAAGGIDLQLLGIGSNGHIAFNEPGTSFKSMTHVTTLNESTLKDNSRFFREDEKVPTQAITMGLKSIIEARKIVLIATGKNKAEAIQHLIEGPITESIPATILKNHPDVTIYVDEDAVSLLKKANR